MGKPFVILADATVETGKAWDHQLRQMITDWVSLKVQTKDQAALLWIVQRAVVGLLLVGVEPELIRRRVESALPPRKEG